MVSLTDPLNNLEIAHKQSGMADMYSQTPDRLCWGGPVFHNVFRRPTVRGQALLSTERIGLTATTKNNDIKA
jgi:hypothetical protein